MTITPIPQFGIEIPVAHNALHDLTQSPPLFFDSKQRAEFSRITALPMQPSYALYAAGVQEQPAIDPAIAGALIFFGLIGLGILIGGTGGLVVVALGILACSSLENIGNPVKQTAPVLRKPDNGATVPPSRVLLTWQASQDPDVAAEGDQLVYDVLLGTTANPTTVVSECQNLTVLQCVLGSSTTLLPNTDYWWAVRVRDRSNEILPSLVSSSRHLITNADAGLVHWWSFNETGGTSVLDNSGYGRDGTLGGGTTRTSGVNGNGIHFDCVNSNIETPSSSLIEIADAWTFSFWVRLDADHLDILQTFLSIGDKGQQSMNDYKNYFDIFNSSGVIAMNYYGDDGSLAQMGTRNNIVLSGDTWQHVAITKSGSVGVTDFAIYINGVVKAVNFLGGNITAQTNTSRKISFGRELAGGRTTCGDGDELMIFDHALQPSEIISLCTRNAPPGIHCGP